MGFRSRHTVWSGVQTTHQHISRSSMLQCAAASPCVSWVNDIWAAGMCVCTCTYIYIHICVCLHLHVCVCICVRALAPCSTAPVDGRTSTVMRQAPSPVNASSTTAGSSGPAADASPRPPAAASTALVAASVLDTGLRGATCRRARCLSLRTSQNCSRACSQGSTSVPPPGATTALPGLLAPAAAAAP